MSQYLVLIYGDEKVYADGGQALQNDVMKGHDAFAGAHASKLVGGNALQGSDTATSIRTDAAGGFTVMDGPFVETKEALNGIYVVEARDLDHAVEIAKLCPAPAPGGGVEVRPVVDPTTNPF